MKAHDLLWKPLKGLYLVILTVAAVLTCIVLFPCMVAADIYDFVKRNEQVKDFLKAAFILAIFLAFYLFSSILMAP